MIKIESDNNIAVVSMDEYNKGLKAIKALEDLAMMPYEVLMPYESFDFVHIRNYEDRYFDNSKGCWQEPDIAIIRKETAKAIKDQMQLEFDIRNESKTLELQEKEKAFEDKLTKARNIKWYHLLFGWRVLGF